MNQDNTEQIQSLEST